MIQPARIAALAEAEAALAEEQRIREQLESKQREHREAMERNQERLAHKKPTATTTTTTTTTDNTTPAVDPATESTTTTTTTATLLAKKRKELETTNTNPIGGENITAVDTTLFNPTTGKITSHASALDAFFAEEDDFGGLFGAEAAVGDDAAASPDALAAESIKQQEAKLAEKLDQIDKDENFIELETTPNSILEEKAKEARRLHEQREAALKSTMRTKSNLSILSKIEEEKGSYKNPFEQYRATLQNHHHHHVNTTTTTTTIIIIITTTTTTRSRSNNSTPTTTTTTHHPQPRHRPQTPYQERF